MWRRIIPLLALLLSCSRNVDFEIVEVKSEREFKVVSVEELPDYFGHCALQVVYLTEEDVGEAVVKEAQELLEEYWGDKIAVRCGVMMIRADRLQPRLGGLFSQTKSTPVVFDLDGQGHWRRAPRR